MQANHNLDSWIVDLQELGVIEARRSPPVDQIEQLEASMGASYFELKLTKQCSNFLKKCKFKNAKKLGLVK